LLLLHPIGGVYELRIDLPATQNDEFGMHVDDVALFEVRNLHLQVAYVDLRLESCLHLEGIHLCHLLGGVLL